MLKVFTVTVPYVRIHDSCSHESPRYRPLPFYYNSEFTTFSFTFTVDPARTNRSVSLVERLLSNALTTSQYDIAAVKHTLDLVVYQIGNLLTGSSFPFYCNASPLRKNYMH
jgi:hypothetical protein